MVVRMNNPKENDYDIFCDNCGSEEICDHEYGMTKSLESIDYCTECCSRCEREAYISKQGIENTQGLIEKYLLLEWT
jgi:hypothetical protein